MLRLIREVSVFRRGVWSNGNTRARGRARADAQKGARVGVSFRSGCECIQEWMRMRVAGPWYRGMLASVVRQTDHNFVTFAADLGAVLGPTSQ